MADKDQQSQIKLLSAQLSESQAIQSALYKITQVATDTDSLEDFYQALHQIVGELMYAENFFIALYNPVEKVVEFGYFIDSVDQINIDTLSALPVETLWKTGTGFILRYGKMLHADSNRLLELQQQGYFEQLGSQCVDWLGVPLISKGVILGALVIQSYDENIYYQKKDEDILQFVSRQIALVLERKQFEGGLQDINVKLEQGVKLRTAQLEKTNQNLQAQIAERERSEKLQKALYRITELTNKTNKLADFLKLIHGIIAELMYAENLYIALLNSSEDQINFPYYNDVYQYQGLSRKFDPATKSQGLTESVLISGTPLLYSKSASNKTFPGRGREPESWLGVPLKNRQKTFGVLAVQSYQQDHEFSKQEKSLLTFVGRHIATAIMRKKDANDIKEAHQKLKAVNDELELRVADRTRELQATNSILRDNINERINIEKKLEHDALHDTLTGLSNRALFSDRLKHALNRIQRKNEKPFAVLFLDLDRFKVINDSLGHHVGDSLLQEISHRLLNCVRPGDTVSRLGGDEFCILLDGIPNAEFAINISQRILKELGKTITLEKQEIHPTCSIGIRLSTISDENPAQVMRDADAAMYQAKADGKARYCLFDKSMHEIVLNKLKLEQELRYAVDEEQLVLYYQPIVDLKTRKITGVEGLLRWNHPSQGMIPPDEFIPIAEETGLIVDVGAKVLSLACQTLQDWKKIPHLKELSISVNISPKQIARGDLLIYIGELLKSHNIDGNKLNLEITENVLMHSFETAKALILGLKSFGIKIYLDDFGSGYSSLNYLYNFPFDVLKLDKVFVHTIHLREENEAIVRSIKMLSSNLKMLSVAEGIETVEQLKMLMEIGYELGQGYFFSKPKKQSEIETFIKSFEFPLVL